MPHNAAKLLHDLVQAGRAIRRFREGRTIEDYRADLMFRSAVERQFEIIGEGLNRLGRADPATLERIDGHQKIIAFRNIIAHGYDVLDEAIVWQVIEDYLPRLLEQVEQWLEDDHEASTEP